MGNKPSGPVKDPTAEYYQILADSTISGETWQELSSNLKKHVANKKMIELEWQKLGEKDNEKNICSELFVAATQSTNREKNRYVNILPFDSTRVKLSTREGVEGSDYINANHVNLESRTYICCQAPLESTVEDFHRMLWENDVRVVVMLTKFVEDGKVKATEYLPPVDEDPQKFGDFHVQVINEETMNNGTFIKRKFVLKKDVERRNITQYHFIAWPDHGVPDEPKELLDMMEQVSKTEEEGDAKNPTVVHCSAGIGRTGTYIIINNFLEVITAAMKKDKDKPPSLNMMKVVHSLRGMRSGMVNHIDQYYYCYHSVISHIDRLLGIESPRKPKENGVKQNGSKHSKEGKKHLKNSKEKSKSEDKKSKSGKEGEEKKHRSKDGEERKHRSKEGEERKHKSKDGDDKKHRNKDGEERKHKRKHKPEATTESTPTDKEPSDPKPENTQETHPDKETQPEKERE